MPRALNESIDLYNFNELSLEDKSVDLLLGNGFSIMLDNNFLYKNLYDKFRPSNELKSKIDVLVQETGSTDFELLLDYLKIFDRLLPAYRLACQEISNDYQAIREGLIQAVASVNFDLDDILRNKMNNNNLIQNFKPYKNIYTLNYDTFLYHAILRLNDLYNSDESMKFQDYFWGNLDVPSDFGQFVNSQNLDMRNVYYLHGALFIYTHNNQVMKVKATTGQRYHETIQNQLTHFRRTPLFVSEGTRGEKLAKIVTNRYLIFAYNKFLRGTNPLIIFGTSLNARDKHIVDAISNRSEIFVSLYDHHNNDSSLIRAACDYKRLLPDKELTFVNAKSVFAVS
ncbi:MAG: DUF4917 family protein [Bacteroidia bacterium]|nr:DUF4917 family protein [Bacteroidia bacterium]